MLKHCTTFTNPLPHINLIIAVGFVNQSLYVFGSCLLGIYHGLCSTDLFMMFIIGRITLLGNIVSGTHDKHKS